MPEGKSSVWCLAVVMNYIWLVVYSLRERPAYLYIQNFQNLFSSNDSKAVICMLSNVLKQWASNHPALWCFELIWKDRGRCAHQYDYYYNYFTPPLPAPFSGGPGLPWQDTNHAMWGWLRSICCEYASSVFMFMDKGFNSFTASLPSALQTLSQAALLQAVTTPACAAWAHWQTALFPVTSLNCQHHCLCSILFV